MDVNKCYDRLNGLWYDSVESIEVLVSNYPKNYQYPDINPIMFVSRALLNYSQYFNLGIKSPGIAGDAAIYLTNYDGKVLAMTSFAIMFDKNHEVNEFSIRQIQGARCCFMDSWEKRLMKLTPWEQALVNVVESAAAASGVPSVSVISAEELNRREFGRLNEKRMFRRYDIPATYRGMSLHADGFYRKEIH